MNFALARAEDDRPAGPRRRAVVPTIDPEDSRAYTWYALRVQPQRELGVQRILDDLGYATFVAVSRRWEFANKQTRAKWEKREVIRPIMPGWCFVGLAPFTPGWSRIVWIPLITGIVCRDGEPLPVPHDSRRDKDGKVISPGLRKLIWEQAQGRFNSPDYQRWQDTQASFEPGDEVETSYEDEAGLIRAKVLEITDRRCKLLLDRGLFGGAAREVDADMTTLRKIE